MFDLDISLQSLEHMGRLRQLERDLEHYPQHKVVTRRYSVEHAEDPMLRSMNDYCMKVVIASTEHL
jgi:hypothetical protein